ncbi:MAG: c-type cytochrome biogenesis protein CcsB [Desulfobulbaceae bacterium]|nr:c-type cytochrome biogenesis protein CcsB [Desulfobulbaceae bacterium]
MKLLFQLTFLIYIFVTLAYLVYFVNQNKRIRTLARYGMLIAAVGHLLYTMIRYLEAGHTPITSLHETISFSALAVTWGYLSFRWRYQVKNFGVFVSPVITALMIVAAFAPQGTTRELTPELQSIWLPIHAGISLLAYGFLALAFCGGVMYLLQEREIKNKRFGLFYSRLPSLEALDRLNRHGLAAGFPLMTLGIITGMIWTKQGSGAYWQWDPKETLSLITWLVYAAIIHQRFTLGWRRRRAAIMVILGFGIALVTLYFASY